MITPKHEGQVREDQTPRHRSRSPRLSTEMLAFKGLLNKRQTQGDKELIGWTSWFNKEYPLSYMHALAVACVERPSAEDN